MKEVNFHQYLALPMHRVWLGKKVVVVQRQSGFILTANMFKESIAALFRVIHHAGNQRRSRLGLVEKDYW